MKRLAFCRFWVLNVSVWLAVFCLPGWSVAQTAPRQKVWPRLVITDKAGPSSLDPMNQLDEVSRRTALQIFEHLVSVEKAGQIKPLLAESWQTLGPGHIRFKLRRGVKFHNGEPFNSQAVVYSLKRLAHTKQSQNLVVQDVRALGEYEVEVKADTTLLLPLLAYSAFMLPPRHTALGILAKQPVGTGPYRFVEHDSQRLRLAINKDYWHRGPGFKAREVIINHSGDEQKRRKWLLEGKTQVLLNINPHLKVSLLRAGTQVRLFSQPSARQYFMVINPCARRPANQLALGDSEFRRALNQAVDVKRIINLVLLGNGIPISSPLNDQILGYSRTKPFYYDKDTAKRVVRRLAPHGMTLTLAVPKSRYVGAVNVARAVSLYLEQIGLRVKVVSLAWPKYLRRILAERTSDWDLYFLGWGNPLLDAGYTLSPGFCESPLTRICTPDLPGLLDKASKLTGSARLRLFRQLDRRLRNLAPWIFLYQGVDNHAASHGLNLRTHPNQDFRVYYDLTRSGDKNETF